MSWRDYFDFEESPSKWYATCFICGAVGRAETEEEAHEWAWNHYHNDHKIISLLRHIEARPEAYFSIMQEDEEGQVWVPLDEVKSAVLKALGIDLEKARKEALKSRVLRVISWHGEEGISVEALARIFEVTEEEMWGLVLELMKNGVIYEKEVGKVALL